jgi:orotidine-5'-phosphate decarboxylase
VTPAERLIVALDVPNLDEARAFAGKLAGLVTRVKVGLELFSAVGPEAVRALRADGFTVMLDLKLHDIPETVARATARVAELGAELLTVHTKGGRKMMEEAARAAEGRTKLLGITVLTSMSELDLAELGITAALPEVVLQRAQLARSAGLAGVVCSPREAEFLRSELGPDFLLVTPGIRAHAAGTDDHTRVASASAARQAGADLVVVGRPIRDAADPRGAAAAIIDELE